MTKEASGDDSVNDSVIENMNIIFQNEANVMVNECSDLGFVFKEVEEFEMNKVCKLVRED